MPKIVKPVSSPNDLWHQQEVDFKFDENSQSADDLAARREMRELQSRTEKQRVLEWFKHMEDRARQVFADHGLPVKPGVYFEPHKGPPEYFGTTFRTRVPPKLFARQEAGEGKIIKWPNFQRIDKLTPPDFARAVLNLVHDLTNELKHKPDPWRVARVALNLLQPYHCMVTEDSGLGKIAVSGLKAQNSAVSATIANKQIVEDRRKIIDRLAKKALSESGNSKKTSAKAIANFIYKDLLSELNKAKLRSDDKAKIRIVGKDQLQRDLRALGYKR